MHYYSTIDGYHDACFLGPPDVGRWCNGKASIASVALATLTVAILLVGVAGPIVQLFASPPATWNARAPGRVAPSYIPQQPHARAVSLEATKATSRKLIKDAQLPTPRLTSGFFRPKQSLGQNFLNHGPTIRRMVDAFAISADAPMSRSVGSSGVTRAGERGLRVLELGPGIGGLTNLLVEKYPMMHAVEIDRRMVEVLRDRHPTLDVMEGDAIQVNYASLAEQIGGAVCVIGNLPFYITSKILYSLINGAHTGSIYVASVTMQYEVGLKLMAAPRSEDYGPLAVVFALYTEPVMDFIIPKDVFYPVPKCDSSFMRIKFRTPAQIAALLRGVSATHLRYVIGASFRQRRKQLRNSLLSAVMQHITDNDKAAAKSLLDSSPRDKTGSALPDGWSTMRPEHMTPQQFVAVTLELFGAQGTVVRGGGPDGQRITALGEYLGTP